MGVGDWSEAACRYYNPSSLDRKARLVVVVGDLEVEVEAVVVVYEREEEVVAVVVARGSRKGCRG